MSVFELMANVFRSGLGRMYPKDVDTRTDYINLVRNARKSVHIVAGELDSSFYCGEFLVALKQALQNSPDMPLSILYHKQKEHSPEEAVRTLSKQNSELLDLLRTEHSRHPKTLKGEDRINLYWAEKRPIRHFCTGDDATYIEEKHRRDEPRATWIFDNASDVADEYKKYFESIRQREFVHRLSLN